MKWLILFCCLSVFAKPTPSQELSVLRDELICCFEELILTHNHNEKMALHRRIRELFLKKQELLQQIRLHLTEPRG